MHVEGNVALPAETFVTGSLADLFPGLLITANLETHHCWLTKPMDQTYEVVVKRLLGLGRRRWKSDLLDSSIRLERKDVNRLVCTIWLKRCD